MPELLRKLEGVYALTDPARSLCAQPFTNEEILMTMMGCPPPEMMDTACSISRMLTVQPELDRDEKAALHRLHARWQEIVQQVAWTITIMAKAAHTPEEPSRRMRSRSTETDHNLPRLEAEAQHGGAEETKQPVTP